MRKPIILVGFVLIVNTLFGQTNSGKDSIFDFVEQMPEFPGGEDSLVRFIIANFKYPERALEKNVQGKVVVTFVIDEKGHITNAKASDSKFIVDETYKKKEVEKEKEALNQEALRIINKMPDWKAGYQNGFPAKVLYRIPIKFAIAEEIADNREEMDEAMTGFIVKNMNYPSIAIQCRLEGVVRVVYDIDETGEVSNARVTKCTFNFEEGYEAAKEALKKEALRVTKKYRPGKPRFRDGKAIKVTYWMPFTFKLDQIDRGGSIPGFR